MISVIWLDAPCSHGARITHPWGSRLARAQASDANGRIDVTIPAPQLAPKFGGFLTVSSLMLKLAFQRRPYLPFPANSEPPAS